VAPPRRGPHHARELPSWCGPPTRHRDATGLPRFARRGARSGRAAFAARGLPRPRGRSPRGRAITNRQRK
jgi:hypothetical protein